PKILWQTQETEGQTMTLADIHSKAGRFQRRVRRRNLTEYVASALVVCAFGFQAFTLPSPYERVGSLLVVIGVVYMVWQLRRRAAAAVVPSEPGSVADFHRRELVRQR